MHCIITAGGLPSPDDPLYELSGGGPKALIDIHGRPMIAYVLDALAGSQHVETMLVVGLPGALDLTFARPVYFLPDHGSLIGNVMAGVDWIRENDPTAEHLIVASADIPSLTTDIVDATIAACQPFNHALYYPLVTQEVMERRYPSSSRTFVRLRDQLIAGGDLVIGHVNLTETNVEFWTALTDARKHAWKLARTVGFGTLLKFLFRRLSIADIEALGPRLLDKPIKVLLIPHAELAMDADKPAQVELLRRDIARQTAASSNA